MCTEVYLENEKRRIATARALADLVGGRDRLVFHEGVDLREMNEILDGPDGDTCLCPIDVHETLTRQDFAVTRDDDFSGYIAMSLRRRGEKTDRTACRRR